MEVVYVPKPDHLQDIPSLVVGQYSLHVCASTAQAPARPEGELIQGCPERADGELSDGLGNPLSQAPEGAYGLVVHPALQVAPEKVVKGGEVR